MRTSSWTILVIACTAVAAGCGDDPPAQTTPSNGDVRSPSTAHTASLRSTTTASTQLLADLENAYRDSSDEQLADFFRRWHETVQPIDVDDVTGPLERELYSLYLAFFRPFDLDALAGSFLQNSEETYDDTYVDVHYIIVPTSLRFRIGDDGIDQTLEDFRPPVDARTAEVLFLTPAYRKALDAFLDLGFGDDTGTDPKERDARIDDVIQRLEFLNSHAKIELGHWAGWDLLTYPSDVYVELSDDMTEAHVSFSMFNLGGLATMKRESGEWRIEDSGIVAME
jgi:hypothetical protein